MTSNLDFIFTQHNNNKRNYLERVTKYDKAKCATEAKKFGKNYWDGERQYGYGGYTYDGRWKSVAEKIINHYQLTEKQSVLDVGCGKGFLLHEMKLLNPNLVIRGIDISNYAIENAKEEVKPFLDLGSATQLPYDAKKFDFVYSINTLHNLYIYDLTKAIQEINRVGKEDAYIVVESYRNEEEKVNLLYWQLTCECLFTPEEWKWIFKQNKYQSDSSFIFFE